MNQLLKVIRSLGPGLLFAGAAIGVSHVVQSTRAGAEFGVFLIWAVLLANLFKYPFFEFGPRYTLATGETLLDGYKRLGNWVVVTILVVSLLTIFTVQAAVTAVTAAIAEYILPLDGPPFLWPALLLAICLTILAIGKYAILDKSIKIILLALAISTVAALAIASFNYTPPKEAISISFDWENAAHIGFLIALMGWMPAPLDLSVWHSLWAKEKQKITGDFSIKTALFDFRVGYIGTAILALCFLGLGALVMYGSGEAFPSSGGAFAKMLIELYTENLGSGAYILIAIAAFTTMFSTTLTCFDAIPRVLSKITLVIGNRDSKNQDNLYWIYIIVLTIGTLVLIEFFGANLLDLVMLATILSFLTAPFFSIANYTLVTGKHIPAEHKPGPFLRFLALLGIVFLIGFSLFYIYVEFL